MGDEKFFHEVRSDIKTTARNVRYGAAFVMSFLMIWVVFVVGFLGAGMFLIGRWTGVW